jgi:hypothetical protein
MICAVKSIARQTLQSCQTSPVDFQPYSLSRKAQNRLKIFDNDNSTVIVLTRHAVVRRYGQKHVTL